MHESLTSIPDRILDLGLISLKQAVTRSALFHLNNAEADQISILNAAHAGELIIKAIIAHEHPLLLFKNLFDTSLRSLGFQPTIASLLRLSANHCFAP